MRRSVIVAVTALACLSNANPARADRRNFSFTYEATTVPEGEGEIEQYLTAKALRKGFDSVLDWNYQLELEYGVTDRFDVAVYQMFGQAPEKPLSWQGYKLRGRYRPVDYEEWPVDPLGYIELIQKADGAIALEQKLVLGKRTENLAAAINLTFEESGLNRDEKELEFAPSVALGYAPRPWVTIGAEALGVMAWEFKDGKTESAAPAYYAGPALSLAHGKAFITFACLWQLGDTAHDRYRARMLLGIDL